LAGSLGTSAGGWLTWDIRRGGYRRSGGRYADPMALLEAFKQKVLELGRTEARAKVKPLLAQGETIDRSAAGLDRRDREAFVLFWILSDQALCIVAGGPRRDWAFRIPFEAIREVSIDFDENASALPWYVRLSLRDVGPQVVTTLDEEPDPANPLVAAPPIYLGGDDLARLARGEMVPLSGFAALPRKFITALTERLEAAGAAVKVSGMDAYEARRARRKTAKKAKKAS
jgi:hypothetical protein